MPDAPLTWDEAVARVCGPGGRYELVDGEVDGRTYKLFKNTPPSLRFLFELSSGYADLDYLVYEDERITFGEAWQRVGAMGALLVDRYGVRHGDRVAIAMRNYPEWIIAFQAITSIGAVAVALNAWWTTDELEYGIQDSGAKVALVDQERAERLAPVQSSLGLAVIGVRLDDDLDGVDRLEDVLDPAAALPDVPVDPDDDATILYTSGTTGHPKGAVSTHRAVLSGLLAFGARSTVSALMEPAKAPDPDAPKDRTSYILVVPLFHATGLIPVMLGTTASGAKLVMMYRWNPERALELIERERVTAFVGVPTMSWDLLESPDFEKRDTSSLVSVGGGGAPAPAELVRRVDKGFAKGKPQIGYGMTETNAYGPGNSGADYLRKPTSSGRAVPVMEVRVVDDGGNPVPAGEVGEICFRGPNLIRGYWNKPEATAEVIDADGWLRSGDLGRLDEEGFIYVEDRAKDMVLRAGENIYCAEVEGVVYEFPGVSEAAVFGVAHERLGEEVALALVPSTDDFDVDALLAHLREHLAGFKVPSIVDLRTERLPRNASGKILKRELRDAAEAARA